MALNEYGGSASDYAAPELGWPGRPLLTLSSSAGGSIKTPTSFTRILRGETILIAAEPIDADLFVFAGWTGSAVDAGKVVDPTSPHTSLTADDDYSLKANFLARTATLIVVDDDGPEDPGPGDAAISDPNERGTIDHPFDSLQEAISVVSQGATIWVEPGTYYESINLMGKNVHLTGIGSNHADTHAYPVIDALDGDTVVTFDHGEDARCQMSGFIITGGYGSQAGAIACIGASPTVTNCLIVGNRSEDRLGGAVYCVDSHGYFGNLTISGNYCGEQGAGVYLIDSAVSFKYSLIVANAPFNVLHSGSSASGGEFRFIEDSEEYCPLFRLPGFWAESSDGIAVSDATQPGATWVHGDYHLAPEVVRWDGEALSWVLDDVTGPCGSPADSDEGAFQMGAYGDPDAAGLSASE